MYRLYLTTALMLVLSGALCAIAATSTLHLALGLALITIGGGAFSAGISTRAMR
jgi:hypothetical protein